MTSHILSRTRASLFAIVLGVTAFLMTLIVFQHTAHPAQAQTAGPDPDTVQPANVKATIADLSITKTNGLTEVVPGTIVFYTLTARNDSTSILTDVVVGDLMPAQFSPVYASAFGSGVRAVKFVTFATGVPVYVTATLDPGALLTLVFTGPVDANASGVMTNTAVISPPVGVDDPNPSNNYAIDADPVRPTPPTSVTVDLSITKTNGLTEILLGPAGATVQYTLTAVNNSGNAVSNVAILDLIPAGYTAQAVNAFGANIANVQVTTGTAGQPLSVTADFGPAGLLNILIRGPVNPNTRGTLANTAIISAPAGVVETNPANNTATDADPIRVITTTPPPTGSQLQITKTDGVTMVVTGEYITYTVTVTNPTTYTLSNVRITDTLPAGFAVSRTAIYVTNEFTPNVSFANNNTAVIGVVTLEPGDVTSITISGQVQAVAASWLTNTVVVGPVGNVPGGTAIDVDWLDGPDLDRRVYLPVLTK